MRHHETHHARTADAVRLHLSRVRGKTGHAIPVLLTHGTFSNAAVCTRLASYLAAQGFDAWVLELRGHGMSPSGAVPIDFEVWSRLDVPAAISTVREKTGARQVFLVGHSGGGLAFLMHLARHPEAAAGIAGLVTLASQATDAARTWSGAVKMALAAALNRLLGRLPGPLLGFGPEDEAGSVMSQWFRWNWSRRWAGRDGFDYLAAAGQVGVPMLCLAGGGDRLIAPPSGCRRLYDAVGSLDKRMMLCARSEGYAEDYTHDRIIASRNARKEIWPQIAQWLARH